MQHILIKIHVFITCRICLKVLSFQSAISPLHGPNWMAMSFNLSTVLKIWKSYALSCSFFDLEPQWSKRHPLLIVQSPCLELTTLITPALVNGSRKKLKMVFSFNKAVSHLILTNLNCRTNSVIVSHLFFFHFNFFFHLKIK